MEFILTRLMQQISPNQCKGALASLVRVLYLLVAQYLCRWDAWAITA